MFIDASALCAVLLNEPEAPAMLKAMEQARGKLMISPVVRVETTLGTARNLRDADGATHMSEAHFDKASELVTELLESLGAREMHLTESMGTAAIAALKKFGKVAGHPAQLNMGDALAYAAAKAFHAPLLYKGNDFAKTDLA
ncbi:MULTISPECIES: type II toxin-antitoxin system VapC family toxin [Roseobacteraceae]|uniref:Ribonuclease VapC42 n=1 Tax=Pseudosulfitobacter pseudonitzschiae TaxID=1402135 RepID=A0A221K8F4_9RHOB|nr:MULTISPECIES: type II toxin-antitoxin system VapC family toxin [Roseobacteraceae]ASM75143.1 ribonuclease VapC42 [Pseudosulfitobacter pseudonitzschiae]